MKSGSLNPDTLEITWETTYQQAHEWAHVEQMARGTILWRWRKRALGIPVIERLANLAVECEAAFLAWREMRGIWTAADTREATAGLWSYVRSIFRNTSCHPS